MKTILTIDCGNRAKECAQGLACAIFNAEEMGILDTEVGARYQGSDVNIVVGDDFEIEEAKEIFSALSRAMSIVIKASKEGFDGNSPEEMLEIFSHPYEGTEFFSNVKDKVDLTIDDLEFLKKELKRAAFTKRMSLGEARQIIESAGKRLL